MPHVGEVLVIGIDAGGTYTRLCARSNDGTPDLILNGDPANALRQGEARSASVLAELIRGALAQRQKYVLRAIHAGVAGAGSQGVQTNMARRLRRRLQLDQECIVAVSHDGITAIEGAFAGESGLLFIAGTGSGVLARTMDGETGHAGGWGYVIGDEGSGQALGRRGLAAVAHAIDGGPVTALSALLQERFGIADRDALLGAVFDRTWPIQQVAPLVLHTAEAGDLVTAHIVHSEVMALARQAEWLLKRVKNVDPRFAISGGLGKSKYYRKCLHHAVRAVWPESNMKRPQHSGLEGAVRLAVKQVVNGSDDFQ